MNDWVATAPTPASAHDTPEPTENACDWTATPMSPVAGSRATIEKVWTGRSGVGADGSAAGAGRAICVRRSAARTAGRAWRHLRRDDTSGHVQSVRRDELFELRLGAVADLPAPHVRI